MDKSEVDAQRLMQAFYRVAMSRHALFRDRISDYGVTLHQLHLLTYMKESGRVRVTDLSDMMLVSVPTASRMLNTLCDKGLARKKTDDRDRRLIYMEPTPKGKRVVEEVQIRQREMLTKVLQQMPAGVMETFLETMEKVADELRSMSKAENTKS
jgi:DNA-binding MarR family transcriptional regulator